MNKEKILKDIQERIDSMSKEDLKQELENYGIEYEDKDNLKTQSYETILPGGTTVRFEYEDKEYSLVAIYVDDEYCGVPVGSLFIKQLLKDLKNKKQEQLDPMKIIELLIKENKPFMITFGDEYKAYLEVLNAQVFEPNGYKLIAQKKKRYK